MNSNPNPPQPPFYKGTWFEIPPVPEYKVSDRSNLAESDLVSKILIIVVIAIVIAFGFVSWEIFRVIHNSTSPGQTPTPTQPVSQTTCPTLVVDGQPPSLAFCSPQFQGYVGGPVGSHIVLDGINLSSTPTSWVIAKKSKAPNINKASTFNKCLSNKSGDDCSPLPTPQSLPSQTASVSLFAWTWNPPQFPSTIGGDYNIITEIGGAANLQIITSSLAFTVLASNPPCISINTDPVKNPSACSTSQSLSLSVNSTVTIYGANWLLGWAAINVPANEVVEVKASCSTSSNCSKQILFDTTISTSSQVDLSQGNFTKTVKLTPGANGSFTVTAFDKVPPVIVVGGQVNTIASQSLTFGGPEDATSLTLNVS